MEERIIDETKKTIKKILDDGIQTTNLEYLDKLVDIYKDAEEVKNMRYGNYEGYGNYGNYSGRRAGYDSYGNYGDNYGRGSYGRRGYDSKYRGHDHLDRMYENYGRYEEGRERYGANEDTKKSLKYMLESMEDFAHMLKQEAQSEEEVQMIRETAQRIAQM